MAIFQTIDKTINMRALWVENKQGVLPGVHADLRMYGAIYYYYGVNVSICIISCTARQVPVLLHKFLLQNR